MITYIQMLYHIGCKKYTIYKDYKNGYIVFSICGLLYSGDDKLRNILETGEFDGVFKAITW